MQRILEPEIMDTPAEAEDYDAMDFTTVNTAFAQRAIELAPEKANILDIGTGTARIPILIAQQRQQWQIIAIDLAPSMLTVGQKNIKQAGLELQIILDRVDAKKMPYQSQAFDLVISNSLVHHLPNPLPFFQEIKRVLKPQGSLFIRDLLRPETEEIINQMVAEIGTNYNLHQKQLFQDSLYAAFTLEEIEKFVQQVGLEDVTIYQSSDRHWTLERV
jgi:ubiquinone/menaquinone biosynthesis C-methylase UbiE